VLPLFLAVILGALPGAARLFAQEAEPDDGLTGFTGFAADVIDRFGEVGVGVLSFAETVFPPIPSEIILSLSGYLAERGRMNVVLVVVAATLGSLLGALVLYALGAWFGEERAKRWLCRLPLVEPSDFENSSRWFQRHGSGVVFFGRFVPIVRSLVSLPAGAQKMSLIPFIVYTTAGSAIWNTALVGAGYALGTQYEKIENYTQYLDYVVIVGVLGFAAWFVAPRLWRKRRKSAAN
jgi:membrane protein DedA with SNARE-associated domain